MAVKIFDLRHVPDEEAEAVRGLLRDAGIACYETPPGGWGISAGAIWLQQDQDRDRARALIDQYQRELAARVHADMTPPQTMLDAFRENPLRFIAYLGIALFVLYLSTKPFIDFGQ